MKDLKGNRYGRLVVLSRAVSRMPYDYRWHCVCNCGNYLDVCQSHLISGHTKSCGCLHSEIASQNGKANATHKMTRTPTYLSWVAMWQRCTNPNDPDYANYGGRGIRICPEWKYFESFLCQMGMRPTGTSLGRINNGQDYCTKNCRWETPIQQARNKRNNRVLICKGKALCLSEWVEVSGIPRSTIKSRLKRGLSAEEVLKEWANSYLWQSAS